VDDKLIIAHVLDELGVHYIEGGWPGANPKDVMFFERVKGERFLTSRIAAFGSTRKAGNTAENDPNLQALVKVGTSVVTIFGKTWDLHVKLMCNTLEENLFMIEDTVAYLKEKGREVIYDAEHFFDGYNANPKYAMLTLQAAARGG